VKIEMEAIVLAGGFGTRLAHVVSDVPKPMAPVCGRPFLRFILDDLQVKGMERVILAVGYRQEIIREYFGGQYRGMQILYSTEDTPLFTGGAIKKALCLCRDDRVFVVNGDTFFDADLNAMLEEETPIVVAVKRLEKFSRYGTVHVSDGRITGFTEKCPCEEGLINGGVYLISRTLLEDIPKEKFSLETEVLEIDMYAYCTIEPTQDKTVSFYAADRDEHYISDAEAQLPLSGVTIQSYKLRFKELEPQYIVVCFNILG